MSISKTECRRHGGQKLRIRPDDGLLHAEAIEWLVTSAVKIIGHSRVLVLHLYSREQAANGGLSPKFTVFHTKDEYITLEYRDDGGTAWRTGAFDRVTGHWQYSKYCAFVSLADEQRVTRYFGDTKGTGFNALKQAQYAIQDKRRAKREKQRQQKMRERMRCVPAVPRGLEEWARRHVMPAYFLYAVKGRKTTPGVCSACGQEIEMPGVKHNAKTVCPHCGRELTMKSRGRVKNLRDRDTCQVIQRTGPNELVIRVFKFEDSPLTGSMRFFETARQFLRQETNGELSCEDYYSKCDGEWKAGIRSVYICYQYQFYADTRGHVYTGNLPHALKGTPWQYCPVAAFYGHFRERMQIRPFLAAHMEHPRLEHLVKTGFYELASDLAYQNIDQNPLNETQARTHRILGIAAEDVSFLRELDVGIDALRVFTQYHGLKDRRKLLLWQLEHDVKRDIPQILQHTTPHKLMRYLEQQRANPDTQQQWRYNSMQNLVTEYRDYLEMSEKLGDDLSNTFVLFPKNLCVAHDAAAARQKIKMSRELRRDFKIAYKRVMSHLGFEMDGLKMVYPADPEEIVHEGQALHHCVGSYLDRVAKKECLILFLRHCDAPEKPYYTVEVRNRKIAQVRGYGNADPTPEVRSFMAAWERKVLQAAA